MTALPRVAECKDCGKGITRQSKTGYCITCGNMRRQADPAFREARLAGIRRKWAEDPEYAERMRKQARRLGQKGAIDEALQERRREYGRWVYANILSRPDVREKNRQAVKAKSGAALRAKRMAWCPQEMWDRYRYLRRTKKLYAADARAIVLKEWADIEAARSGHLGLALDWLNRILSVRKLDDGTYQYGSAILSAGELIKRAELKGWKAPEPFKKPVDNGESPRFSANSNAEHGIEQTMKTQAERAAA